MNICNVLFFVSVDVLKALLLKEVKRNERLKVAVRNARLDSKFPRRQKYNLRKK